MSNIVEYGELGDFEIGDLVRVKKGVWEGEKWIGSEVTKRVCKTQAVGVVKTLMMDLEEDGPRRPWAVIIYPNEHGTSSIYLDMLECISSDYIKTEFSLLLPKKGV
jgi:hypothetical protein